MSESKKKPNTFPLVLWLLVPFGVFFWIVGEIDDSPGAQLVGLIALMYFFYRAGKWLQKKRIARKNKNQQ